MSQAFEKCFSAKAKAQRPSPVRELLKVIKQPGMISFAGGMPAPDVFPVEQFAEGTSLFKEKGADMLQYGTTEGDNELRSLIAKFMAPRLGREVGLENILLTTGSQSALDLFSWSMLDPGDIILVEDPTYMAALNTFLNHQACPVGVECDADGMKMDVLEKTINQLRSQGKTVKAIYTIVNFQNPGGMTMLLERRKKLAQLADQYEIPILEDDPYGYVRYEGEHLPSIFSFDDNDNVLYAGSFSKILAPGTRVGFVIGPANIIRKMTVFKQSTDLCSCTISQSMVREYVKKGYLEKHLPVICSTYKVRRDAMQAAMEKYLSPLGITWVKPAGGFFFWLNLGDVDCEKLMTAALERHVAFVVGTAFCVDPEKGRHFCRINFTFSTPEVIEEGIKRLAEAYQTVR